MAASTPKPQDVVGSGRWGRYLLWSGAIACGRPVEGLWTGGGVVRGSGPLRWGGSRGGGGGGAWRGGGGGGGAGAGGGAEEPRWMAMWLPGAAGAMRSRRAGPGVGARPPVRGEGGGGRAGWHTEGGSRRRGGWSL